MMKDRLTSTNLTLDPKGDSEYARASRVAMLSYASVIRKTDAFLARLIEESVNRHSPDAKKTSKR